MKDQKKIVKLDIKNTFGLTLTIDESLNKYDAPEFESPKLKKAQEKFKSGINFKLPSQ